MNAIKEDIIKLPKLLIGFWGIAIGIVLMKNSDLGLFPWGVFHQGIAENTTLTFGQVTQIVGVILLLISLLFKIYPGIGTFLNIILIGIFVDLFEHIFKLYPEDIWLQLAFLIVGIIINSFGRALYISCHLGKGPRDGMFVGITRITGVSVKYTKPLTEVVILGIGYMLGGVVGIGTVIMLLFSGYFVHCFFKLLKYNPKQVEQRKFRDYFKK